MRDATKPAENGLPPPADEAAALYVGAVMHQRMKPFGHRFQYRVFSLLVDLDRLGEAGRISALFSVNRNNLVSFHESDHVEGDQPAGLRCYADGLLADAGLEERPDRILLCCYPRILGRVFNPIAVYYAYDREGRLVALIYEVRSTFGDRHSYVCRVAPGELSNAGVRQACDKRLHVSPFIAMDMRYHFRMQPPGETIRWRILETDAEGPLLAATFSGRRRSLTSRALLACLLQIPMQTWKIVSAIHFEALRLWLKGAAYFPRRPPPPPVNFGDRSSAAARTASNSDG